MNNFFGSLMKIEKRATPIYIDLKLLRNALSGLKDIDKTVTMEDLMKLAIEKNIVIQDSE